MTIKPQTQLHPGLQLLLFLAIFIGIFIFGNLIGVAITIALYGSQAVTDISTLSLASPQAHNALWIIQLCGTTLPIFLAPVFFAYVVAHDPDDYLKPHFEFPAILILMVLLIAIVSNPLIDFTSMINQKLQLPDALKGIQDWMRQSEDDAQKISDAMMQMPKITNLIAVVLFVGLLTAIVEEFMFRGCLQTILFRWTNNIHAAVWISAILFSAFHMEFFGFLPRMLLGVFLGYFVAWSGSIWTSVLGHFLNNSIAVIATYLFQHKVINYNPDGAHEFNYLVFAISLIITLFLLYGYRYIALRAEQPHEN